MAKSYQIGSAFLHQIVSLRISSVLSHSAEQRLQFIVRDISHTINSIYPYLPKNAV
jgi:hypothetical protein